MAIMLGVLGLVVDFPMITIIAALKSPYMLLKGWRRLFQDCIGREGPFLETICVPFAGLAILLWPLAVAGALLASMLSGIALGLYAAVIVYQVIITKSHIKFDLKSQSCIFFYFSCRVATFYGPDRLKNTFCPTVVKNIMCVKHDPKKTILLQKHCILVNKTV